MFAPVTHYLPVTLIRRERVLPFPGKILARKGQKVGAVDVIAETTLNPEYLMVEVARGLGVSWDRADEVIQCKAGDNLAEGDLIAGPVGMARRVVRSPKDGRVILTGNGRVLLEVAKKPFQLKAGIPGEITDLVSDRGVVIETTGALIQGVWGNGQVDFGLMYALARAPDEILTPDQMDVSLRGSIVMAAHCNDAETLRSAADLPLRGLILASMSSTLVPTALKMRFPIVLLDGFGKRSMNPVAFKLLSTNERREVALNAESFDRYSATRPEVVIPLPGTSSLAAPRQVDTFTPEKQVRIISASFAGEMGTIVSLKGWTVLPSGLKTPAAEVRLEDGKIAVLPLANLEVLA